MTNIERRKIVEAKCLLKEGNDAKYKKGDIVHFKNGEEWLIRNVKENLNKLTIKPYNKIAKNNYISLEIDVDFSFLDKNKVIVKQKAQELAEAEGNLDDEIPKELSNLLKQIREFGGELIYLNRRRYTDGVKGLAPKTSSLRSKVAKLKKQIENQFPRWEVVESYSYPYYFLSDKEAAELKENKSTINKRKKLVMTNVEKKRIVETTIKTLKKKGLLKEYIKDLENELEGSDISEKCKEVWEGYFFDSVDEFDEIMITEGLDAPGSEIAEKYGLDNDNFMWGAK